MLENLVATKLYIPSGQGNLVSRPRLLKRLDEGLRLGKRLTLVSAPAGYGKTTLLSEWIRQSKLLAAWIALDEGDNDAARFYAYLIEALRAIIPGLGESSLAQPKASQIQNPSIVLTPLVNELTAAPGAFLVVLDDYHFIQAVSVHDAVAFLLEHLPPQAHLVIATRADPPLPVARLRGRGQLTELRLNDLRFTVQEASAFLEMALGMRFSTQDVNALSLRTEGWAAGLQMAAASMHSYRGAMAAEDIGAFIRAFTGSNRYILDYLLEEVLQHQPPHIHDFLLQTSILERLCGPLCDTVLGKNVSAALGEDSRAILGLLEQANLFIVPLDDRREWYRYHRLFADLLQQRLGRSEAELVNSLHRRASQWFEEHGYLEEGIEHAIAASEYERAANLIERAAEPILMRSEVKTFLDWVERLPQRTLEGRAALNVYYAWSLLWSGAGIETVEAQLQHAHLGSELTGEVAALRASLALFNGQIETALQLTQQALALLPEEAILLRGLATLMQATAYLSKNNTEAGTRILHEAAQASQRSGNIIVAVSVLCDLAELRQKQGQLRQAQAIYQQALDLATDASGNRMPVASTALIGLGNLVREWNDLETAERMIEEGIELAQRWTVIAATDGYYHLLRIYNARGDQPSIQATLQILHDLARKSEITEIDDLIVEMQEALINIQWGNLAMAHLWAEERGYLDMEKWDCSPEDEHFIITRMRKYEYPVAARLWIAEGHPEAALECMARLDQEAETAQRPSLRIEAAKLSALAHQKLGKTDKALADLERALRIAQPEGFVRIFLDEGEPLKFLLQTLRLRLKDRTLATYADSLLAAFLSHPTSPSLEASTQIAEPASVIIGEKVLVEPLSEREMEVLLLLPSHLSSTEMADELVISVNTLRTHLKNIYSKLNAHSRYEAAARARELGLL